MNTAPLTAKQRSAARSLARAILWGYRANLRHDAPLFVEAVAEQMAEHGHMDVAEATVILIEQHRALLDWPDTIPPRHRA